MREMKVLVFTEYLPPKLGSDRRIFEIMKRLSDRHEVHFIVFPPFRELRDRLPGSEHKSPAYSRQGYSTVKCEGIEGHFFAISPKVALMWQRSLIIAYFLTALSVFLKSVRILRKINPDVIVLNYPSPYTGLLGFLEGKLCKKPVTVDFNDLIAQYSGALLNLKKDSFTAKLLVLIQHYIVKNSDKIVAPTRFIKNYTTSLDVSEKKIAVISNGVDTKIFDPNRSNAAKLKNDLHLSSEKLCVYCGRLDGWAGINIILRLCDMAKTKNLDLKFLLVGSGEDRAVQKENLISFGEIPYEKVPAVLTVADVVLIPFPNNEVSHAASPLKLFEGMAMRKPVVASRVSGIEEVISDGQNGFLADPDNIEEWVRKLEMILNSEKLATRVGQNARKTVEQRFDWAFLARRYEEILNACCLK
jgi:glycosyltransferase involved in cell wall biosynthesis